ncbi:MAG: hypothetical protein KH104_22365, partial [Bacteroides faecis]|nr:hypothetical protein [Bacteroides faecis]
NCLPSYLLRFIIHTQRYEELLWSRIRGLLIAYSVIMDKLWPDGSGNTLRMHKAVDRLRALFKENDLSINIQRKNSAYQLIFGENLFEQANNKNVDEMEII